MKGKEEEESTTTWTTPPPISLCTLDVGAALCSFSVGFVNTFSVWEENLRVFK